MNKIIFLTIATLFLTGRRIFAQNGNKVEGKIAGRIIDSSTGKPMEFATIGLFRQADNTVVNGTTTDKRGPLLYPG